MTQKTFAAGDILLVDFEAWTDQGDLFDTTRQEVADKEGWEAEVELKPMPVLLGEGRVVPGFEEALFEAKVGEEVEIEVPPPKAFGEHNAQLTRLYPRHELEKQDIELEPGTRVQVGERRATITQVTASRVRLDFNHPMAGRTLTYKFKVIEKVEDLDSRIRAFVGLDYSVLRADEFTITVEGKSATIVVPESAMWDSRWFMAKHRLGHDLFEHTDLESVSFVDELTRKAMEAHGHGHAHAHDEDEGAEEEHHAHEASGEEEE